MNQFKEITWDEIKPLFEKFGCPFVKASEIEWYKNSWDALREDQLTLTIINDKYSEVLVKSRAICLLRMSLRFYSICFEEHEIDDYLSSEVLESLKITNQDLLSIYSC